MAISQNDILNALKGVKYPGYTRDIVSFGLIKDIHAHEGHIAVSLELTTADPKVSDALRPAVMEALKKFENEARIDVHLSVAEPAQKKVAAQVELPNIKKKIAIASGKGGVGKSTVAVNLAYSLHKQTGARVGLMDCDIYGPTVPLMMGASGDPMVEDGKLQPFVAHGIKVMSMGLLIDDNAPVVWRGPMITKAIQQFITDVNWGELDYLIVDLPPGTGDAQLTLGQTLQLDGAIVVTTPQVAASQVAIRGAQMFHKLNIPVIGVIENMSYYITHDDKGVERRDYPFGAGGGEKVAEALQAPLLAQLPIDSHLRQNADAGRPILSVEETSESARIYKELAGKISGR
jgi:ATP-binding protein involved in chromosome partitioning